MEAKYQTITLRFNYLLKIHPLSSVHFLSLESFMQQQSMPIAGDVIHVGKLQIRYLQEATQTRRMGCFELTVPPGSNVPPPHSHTANEELIVVLAGTLRYTVGDETRDLQTGDCMSTPPGVVHGFSNPHALVAKALVINSPDIGAQYFRDVAAIVNAGAPDKSKLLSTMQHYGLEIAPSRT